MASNCLHCGEKLVPIGSSRENGADHDDWDDREFHKSCWKNLTKEEVEDYYWHKRVYISVPFEEKDSAKDDGAKWDAEKKCWYAYNRDFYTYHLSRFKIVDVNAR